MKNNTRQRTAILRAIEQSGSPLTPREILATASLDVGTLGVATVYRTLKELLDAGACRQILTDGGSLYESVHRSGQRYRFQCVACRKLYEMKDEPALVEALAPDGFNLQAHGFTFYGRCADCAAAPARGRT